MSRKRNTLIVLALLLPVTIMAAPWIGRTNVSLADVQAGWWDEQMSTGGRIFWYLRMPRTLMAGVAGAALACAGAVFQAMFRNPLASPFTLGASSGASLAAALAFHFGVAESSAGWPILPLVAFAGAMASVLLVYGVVRVRRGFATGTLLLAGVSIGFMCSSGILLIHFVSTTAVTDATVKWLMGSVEVTNYQAVLHGCAFLVSAGTVVWLLRRELDLLLMGELVAVSRGVSVARTRAAVYFASSLMVAGVVAYCGPIGFVGLVVPHLMRGLCGPKHGLLLPGCVLGGATFLIWCDVASRNVMHWTQDSPAQIPVGVLTSLLGGMFFLYLLLTHRRERAIV
jgi:iron complex transport system permease protein